MSARVLVVEDDGELGSQIVRHLEGAGLVVKWVRDGAAARDVDLAPYALVVLDLMLPGAYGMDVLKHLRKTSDVPVIMLTARNETSDKVRALELGADDYVTKPFWPDELVARVQARLRRPVLARGDVIEVGVLKIDLGARTVHVAGSAVELTPVEHDLLVALAKRPGAAMTRTALVEAALDLGNERTLDVHVSRLRKKLGDAGPKITTVWGIGYRLDAGSAA